MSCHWWLGYSAWERERERRIFFFVWHVVWIKKMEKYSGFLNFKQPHITLLPVHLIWKERADQEGNLRTQVPLLSPHFQFSLFFFFCLSIWVNLSLVRFSLVQFSSVQLGFRCPAAVSLTLSVSVLLRLFSTASRSCPSLQSTPGSCHHTGRLHWSRDCCGHCKHGLEPANKNRTCFTRTWCFPLSITEMLIMHDFRQQRILPWTVNKGKRRDGPSQSRLQ